MTHWHIKELALITKISVRTLHHYDRIELLRPSLRESNGYRLYTEPDLLKLQQIIALKFFGFKLSEIKNFLRSNNFVKHFARQAQLLQEKARRLEEASMALNDIIARSTSQNSVPWQIIIETIGVYQMSQKLENSWLKGILNQEEVNDYLNFQESLKTRFTPLEKTIFEDEWASLIQQINSNLDEDPAGDFGCILAKRCLDLINGLFGPQYAHLRGTIWRKGFMQGHAERAHGISAASVSWLNTAMDSYWRKRIYAALAQKDLAKIWSEIEQEMHGDDQFQKDELRKAALADERVPQAGKDWLRKRYSLP